MALLSPVFLVVLVGCLPFMLASALLWIGVRAFEVAFDLERSDKCQL